MMSWWRPHEIVCDMWWQDIVCVLIQPVIIIFNHRSEYDHISAQCHWLLACHPMACTLTRSWWSCLNLTQKALKKCWIIRSLWNIKAKMWMIAWFWKWTLVFCLKIYSKQSHYFTEVKSLITILTLTQFQLLLEEWKVNNCRFHKYCLTWDWHCHMTMETVWGESLSQWWQWSWVNTSDHLTTWSLYQYDDVRVKTPWHGVWWQDIFCVLIKPIIRIAWPHLSSWGWVTMVSDPCHLHPSLSSQGLDTYQIMNRYLNTIQ